MQYDGWLLAACLGFLDDCQRTVRRVAGLLQRRRQQREVGGERQRVLRSRVRPERAVL